MGLAKNENQAASRRCRAEAEGRGNANLFKNSRSFVLLRLVHRADQSRKVFMYNTMQVVLYVM